MDGAISAIIGAIIFTAFVAGLAESIGAVSFILIVFLAVILMGIDTVQVVKSSLAGGKSD